MVYNYDQPLLANETHWRAIMKRFSRLLTFVLAFVLCMSMGIATTLADDGPEAKWSADGGTWQEGTLMDAVWAAYGADAKIEIQLQRSVTLDAS